MKQAIDPAANPYQHEKNIQHGRGRIIWNPYQQVTVYERGAWALLGGSWTPDFEVAMHAAKLIDKLSK